MAKVIAFLTLTPLGTGEASLSQFVAAGIKALDQFPQVSHETTPHGDHSPRRERGDYRGRSSHAGSHLCPRGPAAIHLAQD